MVLTIILAAFLVLFINFIIARKMESVAAIKGYGGEIHAFSMCFWLGIIGYIYVAALPDQIQQQQNQRLIELLEKKHEKM